MLDETKEFLDRIKLKVIKVAINMDNLIRQTMNKRKLLINTKL